MSQQGNYNSTPQIQAALAAAKEAAKDNPKALKAIALVENTISTAGLFAEHVKLRYPNKKRIFCKRDRTTKRFKKQEKAIKLAVNSMQIRMSIIKQMQIASQPLPKFPNGRNGEYGAVEIIGGAYVGEHGEERIINAVASNAFDVLNYYERRVQFRIDKCDHVFGTKAINGNWHGDMSAICMKCGYEP